MFCQSIISNILNDDPLVKHILAILNWNESGLKLPSMLSLIIKDDYKVNGENIKKLLFYKPIQITLKKNTP